MNITFHTRKLINYSINTRKKILLKLTLKAFNSVMKQRINLSFNKEIDDIAIICKYNKEIIGWSCIFDGNKVMLFIKPEFRRKGIGKRLLQRAESYLRKNDYQNVKVAAWNNTSSLFYKKTKYREMNNVSTFGMEKEI